MILTALISAEILAQHADDPEWVVFDCRHDLTDPTRGRREYAESHIPGAQFLHLDEDLSAPKTGTNGRHPLPDPRVLMEKLGRAGVDSRKQVVAYDAQGGMAAAPRLSELALRRSIGSSRRRARQQIGRAHV